MKWFWETLRRRRAETAREREEAARLREQAEARRVNAEAQKERAQAAVPGFRELAAALVEIQERNHLGESLSRIMREKR